MCFVCKEPGTCKRDCPVHKVALKTEVFNFKGYQDVYDCRRATSSGCGPGCNGEAQARGGGGPGGGAAGQVMRGDSGRSNPSRGGDRSMPSHCGPPVTAVRV